MAKLSRWRQPLIGYGLALLMLVIAFLLTLLIPELFGPNPFLLFFAAVTLSAWYGGFGPGILGSLVSLILVKQVFLRSPDFLAFTSVDIGRLATFLVVTGVVGVLHWQHQHTLDALRRSRDQLDIYLRDMANGVMVQNQQGKVIYANYEAAKLMGFVSGEAMVNASADLVLRPYEIFDELGEPLPSTSLPGRLALLGMQYPETVLRVRFKDTGAERWAYDKARPIFDEHGHVQASVSLFLDITELKDAQQALAEQREQLQVTLRSIGDAVIATDAEGKITFVNPLATSLTGWAERFALEKPITDIVRIVDEASQQPVDSPLNRVQQGIPVHLADHLLLVAKDGTQHPIEVTGAPMRDEHDRLIGMVIVLRDMAEARAAEARLRARIRQQEIVAALGLRALEETDLTTLMQEVIEALVQCLQVENGAALELLPDGKMLLRAGVGWHDGLVGHATVDTGFDSQAGFTLISKEPVIVEDLNTETRFHGPLLLLEHEIVSGMSVIIAGDNDPWGVLGVHTRQRRVFTKDDIYFVQAVANLLASSISRERVVQAEREQRILAEALRNTAEVLGSTLDLSQVLDRILANVERVVTPDSADIMLIEGDHARVVGSRGYERHDMAKMMVDFELPLTTRTLNEMILTGQPVIVNDVAQYADWVKIPSMEWIRSYVGVPLKIKGKIKGVLNLCSAQPNFFTPEQVRGLQAFAVQAAIAIRNAQLYAEARETSQHRSVS